MNADKNEDVYQQLKDYVRRHIQADDALIDLFCSRFHLKITKRNELLLQAGEVNPNMYFVNTGCLRVYMLDEQGRESTRFLVFEGRFGTAFPSFTLQEPSLAYIQSLEPSELLYISRKDFCELFDIIPGWERAYRINLEQDYIDSIKRIESLITMDALERYSMLMDNSATLIQRLPSKIIADYLGVSQETLSRLKSKK